MNTTEIDKLIAIKKKSDASEKNKQLFQEKWLELVENEGLNMDVIKYLYEGFSFAGAVPLVTYIQKTKTAVSDINEFFTDSDYAERNKAITSKLLLHLLALSFKLLPEYHDLIKFTIKKLPFFCKDEKGLLTDSKTLKKYFFIELSGTNIFPQIDVSDIKVYFDSFCIKLCNSLDNLIKEKETSENDMKTINRIKKWFLLYKTEDDPVQAINDTLQNKTIGTSDDVNIQPLKNKTMTEKAPDANECFSKILKATDNLKIIVEDLKTENRQLISSTENLQKELSDKSNLYLQEKEKKQEAFAELLKAKEKNAEFSESISTLEKLIVSKNDEIKIIEKQGEMRLQQKTAEKEISLNRISGDLKLDYKDFLSAADCTMTTDLGENMREQLKSVFLVLKKHGINLE